MPEYLSPGVYVEEISTGPKPIEGVSTSTAGFVGPTERGPTAPRLVTSWLDYQRWFGSYLEPSKTYLPYSVQGFFQNGGRRAFIARVTGDGDPTATLELATDNANSTLVATATGAGSWGRNVMMRVTNGTRTKPGTGAGPLFRVTLLYFQDGVPSPFIDPTDPTNRNEPGFREPNVIEDYDNLTAVAGAATYVVKAINSGSRLIQLEYAGDPARPDNQDFTAFTVPGGAALGGTAAVSARAAADGLGALSDDDTVPDIDAAMGAAAANLDTVLAALAIDDPARDAVQAARDKADDDTGNKAAKLTRAAEAAAELEGLLGSGSGSAALTPGDFKGDDQKPPNERTGLAGMAAIDEVSLLVVPDHVNEGLFDDAQRNKVTTDTLDQCDLLRDRFAVLSVERGQGQVQSIFPVRDTSYGAIYYPWVRAFDPRTQDTVLLPPAGHVAGIYARTDIERGVHKAPANEVVRGIITRDLSGNRGPLEYKITKGEHDILNPRGIDVIRDFRSDRRGIRVWGARTMSSDGEWKYVNVRRLFLFIEESIDEGTQWVVFEPNHEPTWGRVVRSVSNFLVRVWRDGALMGITQDEAFFVKCDRTTMTQDDIDNGRLICYIGIAPVKPAEFVIFRISQQTIEATQ